MWLAIKKSHDKKIAKVNLTIKASDVDRFGSLKLPIEEGKLIETSLGRLGLQASKTLLPVTFSIYTSE